ncbi:MAG: DUF3054 domain-containing protein [Anaerolineales bacterium]|jgi:hypothetical protein
MRKQQAVLLAGDVLAFAIITLFGFSSHEELVASAVSRMLATFLPFLAAWLLVAPWLDLYDPTARKQSTLLWRTPLAAVLAAPFGAWLRGLVLSAPILPVFVLVMAGVSALAMTLWRLAASILLFRNPSE